MQGVYIKLYKNLAFESGIINTPDSADITYQQLFGKIDINEFD